MKERHYYVYFLMNKLHTTLYIGITSNLQKRLWQHQEKIAKGFTKKYNITKLVFNETYDDPETAIAREKQLKRWSRIKKEAIIKRLNPRLVDLSLAWN